eukprot:scaffold11629_cov63-Phaeocystis_antarctica.AAC.1
MPLSSPGCGPGRVGALLGGRSLCGRRRGRRRRACPPPQERARHDGRRLAHGARVQGDLRGGGPLGLLREAPLLGRLERGVELGLLGLPDLLAARARRRLLGIRG